MLPRIASRAASVMWRMRMRSSGRILNLRFFQNILAEIAAQIRRGTKTMEKGRDAALPFLSHLAALHRT